MTRTTTETIERFIERNNISMRSIRLLERADENATDWGKGASHWQVRIEAGPYRMQSMAVPFSMGSAHKGSPRLRDVLDCLASDASGVEGARDFEDWAGDYGYDTDSRKALATYEACVKVRDQLLAMLGRTEYTNLLENVERL